MANSEIKVAIEASIHKTIEEVVEEIHDKFGVQITDISITWAYSHNRSTPFSVGIKTVSYYATK